MKLFIQVAFLLFALVGFTQTAAENQEATNNNLRASNGHRELGVDGTRGKKSCLYAYMQWECDSRFLGMCTNGAYRHQHEDGDYFFYCVERKGSHNDEFLPTIGIADAFLSFGGDYLQFSDTRTCSTLLECDGRSHDGNKCDDKGKDDYSTWDVYKCTV